MAEECPEIWWNERARAIEGNATQWVLVLEMCPVIYWHWASQTLLIVSSFEQGWQEVVDGHPPFPAKMKRKSEVAAYRKSSVKNGPQHEQWLGKVQLTHCSLTVAGFSKPKAWDYRWNQCMLTHSLVPGKGLWMVQCPSHSSANERRSRQNERYSTQASICMKKCVYN